MALENIEIHPGESSADYCRRKGWSVGTLLSGRDDHDRVVIQITAQGEEIVLAQVVWRAGEVVREKEGIWSLDSALVDFG
jgi:hypothetical protein